jgi:hypothetical protein
MPDEAAGERRPWRRKLLSIPGLIAVTVVTILAGWGATQLTAAVDNKLSARDPISWTVETNPAHVGAFEDLPIALTLPSQVQPTTGPGVGCRQFYPWARTNGGVDAGTTRLQLALQSQAAGQLLIADARAVVVGNDRLTTGINVECLRAGEADLRTLTIDLDSPNPRARYQFSSGRNFGFTLNKGEIETFLVTATAEKATYSWFLELTVVANEQASAIRIDDDGKPFRTTASTTGTVWTWDFAGSWRSDLGTVPVGGKLAPNTR